MMTFPPVTRLSPVNVCIYCGVTPEKAKLTDEHIIPLSLGGTYILPKASCLKCADATKRFEGYAARHIFQDVRIEYGLPTRNPEQRPEALPLRESFSPSPELAPIRLVPAKEYPGYLFLMAQEPAGIILGHAPDQETKGTLFIYEITGRDRVNALVKRGIKPLIYREIRPDIIARLYAKIALGFAVAGPGLQAFKPTILDVILRQDANPFYWVGGTTPGMNHFPPTTEQSVVHRAVMYMCYIQYVPYLLVQVQLFACFATPTVTVVVGKLTNAGVDKLRS